jgi:hypothetical protein
VDRDHYAIVESANGSGPPLVGRFIHLEPRTPGAVEAAGRNELLYANNEYHFKRRSTLEEMAWRGYAMRISTSIGRGWQEDQAKLFWFMGIGLRDDEYEKIWEEGPLILSGSCDIWVDALDAHPGFGMENPTNEIGCPIFKWSKDQRAVKEPD